MVVSFLIRDQRLALGIVLLFAHEFYQDKRMHIDLREGEIWEKLSDRAAQLVGAPEGHTVRVYQGAFAALYETVHSLVQLFPHKKSMALINGATPFFEPLMPYFFRETFQIQNIVPSQIESPEGYVASLQKDTLFVLLCDDHAVTGQLYDFAKIEELLTEKKIFCIRLSHSEHFTQKRWPKNFSSTIFSVAPDLAISVSGPRVKALTILSANLQWNSVKVEADLENYAKKVDLVDRAAVENFEANLPEWATPLLAKNTARVFDRACIVIKEMNSEAFQKELAKELGINLNSPSYEREIESLNACRWNQMRDQAWWSDPTPKTEDWQGGLILSTKTIKHPTFKQALEKTHKTLKTQQG